MITRLGIINRIAAASARQIGVRYPELLFGRDRSVLVARARSLAIAISLAGVRDLTTGQVAKQFGRHHSTMSYHAALWRLKRNAPDWNLTVSALRPDWPDAPGPR